MMMSNTKPSGMRRLLIDAAGFGLIFLGLAFGWLPGPGGVPLILAGLGLLAQNYEWARRLQGKLIKQGRNALETFFPRHPAAHIIYDILSLLLLAGAVWVLYRTTGRLWDALAVAGFFTGLMLLAGNRQRLQRFTAWLNRKK